MCWLRESSSELEGGRGRCRDIVRMVEGIGVGVIGAERDSYRARYARGWDRESRG